MIMGFNRRCCSWDGEGQGERCRTWTHVDMLWEKQASKNDPVPSSPGRLHTMILSQRLHAVHQLHHVVGVLALPSCCEANEECLTGCLSCDGKHHHLETRHQRVHRRHNDIALGARALQRAPASYFARRLQEERPLSMGVK